MKIEAHKIGFCTIIHAYREKSFTQEAQCNLSHTLQKNARDGHLSVLPLKDGNGLIYLMEILKQRKWQKYSK